MKVLIFHQFTNHNELVASLCFQLNSRNVNADSFNISTWELDSINNKLPKHILFLKTILFHYKLKLAFFSLFPFLFKSFVCGYDVIDIHFFGTFYYKMIYFLLRLNKKIKITIWGSDFYRSSPKRREKQRIYYTKVNAIQVATQQMKIDFIDYYKEFDEKTKLGHFGLIQYEVIDDLLLSENLKKTKKALGIPQDKLIITCGSNGIMEQQHMLIIKALGKLDATIKNSIFLIFPMTNGFDEGYRTELESSLLVNNLSYVVLQKKLTLKDVCRLRIVTDIAINIQKTDAFSATIQEHLYAKNILVVGDWLPYGKLDDHDVFYYKTTIQNLYSTLEQAIVNYKSIKEKTEYNVEKMKAITSWDAAINDWIANYRSLLY